MAATDERAIHEFPTGTIDDNSLLIMDRPTLTPGEYETEKFAIANLGLKLLGGIDFPNNLDTDEQDIFGAINEVNAKAMNIAAEYDETESYSKGDYCIYQNTAYRCIKASGTTTGSFVAADWSQIFVLDEVESKLDKSAFNITRVELQSPNLYESMWFFRQGRLCIIECQTILAPNVTIPVGGTLDLYTIQNQNNYPDTLKASALFISGGLVGMVRFDNTTGKITLYNQSGSVIGQNAAINFVLSYAAQG